MSFDDMQDLVNDFIVESEELIEKLDQDLVELEHRKNDLDLLNGIFRCAHTIKGSSSFLGFDKMATVTHHAEEILNKLRKGEMAVTKEIMDVLLEFVDVVKQLMDDIKNNSDTASIDETVKKLKLANEGKLVAPSSVKTQEQPGKTKESKKNVNKPSQIKKVTKAIEQTIRVDVSRLDSLMNLVGELVLSRNRITQLAVELEKKYEGDFIIEQLAETTSQIGLITTELQLAVMKTRMVPIGKVFNKFPRMVRDLCRDLNKEIDLVIAGEDTELDKSVVEEIGDPLIHMIRNAVDHGVESPEERVKKGKPKKGTVWLNAYHEGNHIVIEIKDDGKGIDPEKIKQKAIEKDVITPDEAKNLNKEEVLGLIFKPGFSTAEKVTGVSGRGVGMDVVKTNIEKLNGIITIESEINKGSTFKLKLPLTLAIIQALLVEVSGEVFAIPLVSVIETVKINDNEIHSFEGREVLKLRDSVLSLIRLDEVFQLEGSFSQDMYVVVVALAEKRIGLIVDRLVGQEEIVIKSLGEYLGGNVGIAGATIMGDGKVRLIVDVSGVMEIATKMPRRSKRKSMKNLYKNSNNIKALIVDDSATDRKIMKRLLTSTGWIDTVEVSNPNDAMHAAQKVDIDLLITDIVMPDMDGFELARTLREKGFEKPIIAVSSRGEAGNMQKAKLSGIDAFLVKPINLDEMVAKINSLVQKTNV
ncbi:chemotaxis protein CheW [Deferribacterales bacterium Es71-Z0220]|uniref:hybrid sensor histidine kinase/response regulator n=1 Tax=Deferrivibrio essentukiensis TaxID=2880922 RepID=UPI001F6240D1|nr:chemotaxis protein CheW [Deferrivibrio essentukiensis]MCB4204589.1 chemotaxis protein CheW [Deferrivibrio essentukiensis]